MGLLEKGGIVCLLLLIVGAELQLGGYTEQTECSKVGKLRSPGRVLPLVRQKLMKSIFKSKGGRQLELVYFASQVVQGTNWRLIFKSSLPEEVIFVGAQVFTSLEGRTVVTKASFSNSLEDVAFFLGAHVDKDKLEPLSCGDLAADLKLKKLKRNWRKNLKKGFKEPNDSEELNIDVKSEKELEDRLEQIMPGFRMKYIDEQNRHLKKRPFGQAERDPNSAQIDGNDDLLKTGPSEKVFAEPTASKKSGILKVENLTQTAESQSFPNEVQNVQKRAENATQLGASSNSGNIIQYFFSVIKNQLSRDGEKKSDSQKSVQKDQILKPHEAGKDGQGDQASNLSESKNHVVPVVPQLQPELIVPVPSEKYLLTGSAFEKTENK